ncbi:MAG: TIGR03936 family radical SAM-associated protein [Oscillospiraceae bacterium]|nr:TIGR03936 family radical SAM-associated protein [Oscillospiraceae bacterium]
MDTSDTTKTDTPDITPTTYTHVRVFFEKTGRAKYISHLDLYRLIMRALKAANIPVWETAGFNKRMYVMFDLPLPLGVSGLRESFEVKLPVEFVENHLNGLRLLDRVLPDGIRILSASTPVIKHTEIAYAKYVIRGSFPQFDLFLSQPKIPVTKHTKKNDTVLDLKPLIKNPTITDTELTVLLPSGQSFSVGANLLIDAYNKFAENAATITDITRVALYTEDGREFI